MNNTHKQFLELLKSKNSQECLKFLNTHKIDFNCITQLNDQSSELGSFLNIMIRNFKEEECLAFLATNPDYKLLPQPQELFKAIDSCDTQIIEYILDRIDNCDYCRKFYSDNGDIEETGMTVLATAAYHLTGENIDLFKRILAKTHTHINHISHVSYYDGDRGHDNAGHLAAYACDTANLQLLYESGLNFSQQELYNLLTPCELLYDCCKDEEQLHVFEEFILKNPELIELERQRRHKPFIENLINNYPKIPLSQFFLHFDLLLDKQCLQTLIPQGTKNSNKHKI